MSLCSCFIQGHFLLRDLCGGTHEPLSGFYWSTRTNVLTGFIRTNVLISLGPASEASIPCSGAGISTPGCRAMGVGCCHQGGDRPALARSPCKPGGLAALKGRNEDISHSLSLKEQEHPSILRSWEGSNSCPAWLGGFGY